MNETSLLGRLRWWFRWWVARWQARLRFRGDVSTAAALLAAGKPLPGPLSAPLPAPALPPSDVPLVPESATDFHSIPSSARLVSGSGAPVFRVASTRMLPPPLRELAIFRPAAWPLTPPAPPPAPETAHRPGPRALGLARESPARVHAPSLRLASFGITDDGASSRVERAPPPTRREPLRPSLRLNLAPRKHPAVTPLGVLDPAKFGLDDDLRPPLEANAVPARVPPPLSPARANFRAKYVDPARPPDQVVRVFPTTFGELVRAGVEPRFQAVALGATDQWKDREIPESLKEQLEEVHEQFLLRRDVAKMEPEEGELVGKLASTSGLGPPMKAFTGLEFMDLQPTPVKPLQMRLEHAPVDMRPFVEPTMDALAMLVRAVREHRDEPPPVPAVAGP